MSLGRPAKTTSTRPDNQTDDLHLGRTSRSSATPARLTTATLARETHDEEVARLGDELAARDETTEKQQGEITELRQAIANGSTPASCRQWNGG